MQNVTFGANPQNLIKTLPDNIKPLVSFLAKQEAKGSLSNSRFVQDTATNWLPKAIFARSTADLAETSFLEFAESFLVYYCPKILGENVFRKIYAKNLNKDLSKNISKPLVEMLKDQNMPKENLKKLAPIKAAIALSCMAIPLTEFCLTYVKNLFTLKLFKQGDFNNIANLNKNKIETDEKQQKVKKSAIAHITGAAAVFAGCLLTSALLVKKGHSSKALQNLSELILAPGNKLASKNQKAANFINKYFSIDFANDNGKLALSRGQLTACVLIGGLGYFGSAKDRGKQNFLETLFRFPLVGFYVITGSDLFAKGFKKLLKNKESYKDLIKNNLDVPSFSELPELAQKLATKNNTSVEREFERLSRKKTIISAVPFLFSIGFMGLFVAGISRAFTQYRYNKEEKVKKAASGFSNPFIPRDMDDFKQKVKDNKNVSFGQF